MAALDQLPPAGRVRKYKSLLFWPQGGVVCIVDESKDGEFTTATAAEFAARVIQIRYLIERGTHKYADERNADYNFVCDGAACVKEARKQGDPFDPKVLEHLLRHRRRSFIFTGNGTGKVLHTAGVLHDANSPAAREVAVQNALLPPIPKAPPDKPIKSLT